MNQFFIRLAYSFSYRKETITYPRFVSYGRYHCVLHASLNLMVLLSQHSVCFYLWRQQNDCCFLKSSCPSEVYAFGCLIHSWWWCFWRIWNYYDNWGNLRRWPLIPVNMFSPSWQILSFWNCKPKQNFSFLWCRGLLQRLN